MTPYGAPSAALCEGLLAGSPAFFLPRHGDGHALPPHRINYRANIAALREAGVTDILAVTAVGGISAEAAPGSIVVPDQIIDYTWGRDHTLYDGLNGTLDHVDFSQPYTERLRRLLIDQMTDGELVGAGVYGATQGPRLESAAEIARMARDGCTIVGMTGMPEAALAREAGMAYATVSLVVNWAAGVGGAAVISMDDIYHHLDVGMAAVVRRVGRAIAAGLSQPDPASDSP
jgi:purine nucleoside phosphorylase